jgi:MFS family permease
VTRPTSEGAPAGRARGRLVAAVAIAAALTPLNSTMIAVALPALSTEFSVAAAGVTLWVVTGYLVATIACQIPAGSVADGVGYGRALTLGRWLFTAGSAVGFAAPMLAFVVTGRLLMAAGGALMVPTAMALLRVSVPIERRARAFGSLGAVMAGAAAVGPAIGGLVAAQFGWRALFLINLPLVALSAALQPRLRQGFGGASPEREARRRARTIEQGGGSEERRGRTWSFDLIQVPAFAAGAAIIALQNLAMYALMFQVPFLFALHGRGGDPRIGLAIMSMAATMALSSPVGGWLADRAGARPVVLVGGVLGAAGILSLTRLGSPLSLVSVGARLLFVGLGLGLSTGPSQAAALSAIDPRRSAMASAQLSMLRYLGAVAGTSILSAALGQSADNLARQQAALWIFGAAFAASCLFAPVLGGHRSETGHRVTETQS